MLPGVEYVASVVELVVGVVRVFVFRFLLEVGQVGVVVHCVVEVVYVFVGDCSFWVLEQLVVVVEAELGLAVVGLEGVGVVTLFQQL